jgi:hypothetical protein
VDSFSSRYNYYDGNKHSGDYLYPITTDVLGSWKHYNLSADTLNYRNSRAKSPLVTRELNRCITSSPFHGQHSFTFSLIDIMRKEPTMLVT